MNKSLVLAGLVVASTSMMAMDTQYFIGAGAEKTNIDTKVSGADGYNSKGKIDDTGLSLKTGVILNKAHRISLSLVKYSENDSDVTSILGNYDYLIPINNDFRFFTGLHAGSTKVKVEESGESASFSGLSYGVQIGAMYDLTKNIEFELGLGYTKYNVDRTEDDTWYKLELDKSTSMFAGINYKF